MEHVDHKGVGQRIKDLREKNGYSQQKAAGLIGLKQNSLSNLETGHTKLSFELAVIIAETFDVSVDALVVKQ